MRIGNVLKSVATYEIFSNAAKHAAKNIAKKILIFESLAFGDTPSIPPFFSKSGQKKCKKK